MMPSFELTSPDGRKFQVTAPEGATQEQVLAYVQQHFGTPERSPVADIGSGFNETLASTIDAPVAAWNQGMKGALAKYGINITGDPITLRGLMEGARMVNPEGTPETPYTGAGRMLFWAVPGVGIMAREAKSVQMAGSPFALNYAKGVTERAKGFLQAPGAAARKEVAATTAAAAGGVVGQSEPVQKQIRKVIPDEEVSNTVGEIVGQLTGGFTPEATKAVLKPTLGRAWNFYYQHIAPTGHILRAARAFTKAGVTETAAKKLQENIPNARAAVNAAANAEVMPNTGSLLTPAMKSMNANAIALEKSVVAKDPLLEKTVLENAQATLDQATTALQGKVGPDAVRQFYGIMRDRINSALDLRLAAATRELDGKIAALAPTASREQVSNTMNTVLESAREDASTYGNKLFQALDETAQIGLRETPEAYRALIGPESPLPKGVRKSIKSWMKGAATGEGEIPIVSFKDLKEFRSRVIRQQDASAKAGNAEAAFFLGKMSSAITNDIKSSGLGADFQIAADYWKKYNDVFTRGKVGQLLRYSPIKGRQVKPELVSEEVFSGKAPKQAANVQDIRAAAEFGTRTANQDLEDALADRIRQQVFTDRGEFLPKKAKTLIDANGELLDQFPRLKSELLSAVEGGEGLTALQASAKEVRGSMENAQKSALALATHTAPDATEVGSNFMNSLMRSPNRRELLMNAVKETRKEPLAFQGLQDAYTRELLAQAAGRPRELSLGNRSVGGKKMRTFFESTKYDAFRTGLFTPDELKRIDTIVHTVELVDKWVNTGKAPAGLLQMRSGAIQDFVVRVISVALGKRISNEVGSQELVIAGASSRTGRTLANAFPQGKLNTLLANAVRDEHLWADLLTRPTTKAQQEKLAKRLNAWLAGTDPFAMMQQNQQEQP